jgi:hypothetical protein
VPAPGPEWYFCCLPWWISVAPLPDHLRGGGRAQLKAAARFPPKDAQAAVRPDARAVESAHGHQ